MLFHFDTYICIKLQYIVLIFQINTILFRWQRMDSSSCTSKQFVCTFQPWWYLLNVNSNTYTGFHFQTMCTQCKYIRFCYPCKYCYSWTYDKKTSALALNSSPPMCQWIRSAVRQIMPCRLFCAKPLSKPMLGIINWTLRIKTLVKFQRKYKIFIHQMHLNLSPAKFELFWPGGDELIEITNYRASMIHGPQFSSTCSILHSINASPKITCAFTWN